MYFLHRRSRSCTRRFAIDVILDPIVTTLGVPDLDRCAVERGVREEERVQGRCVGRVRWREMWRWSGFRLMRGGF